MKQPRLIISIKGTTLTEENRALVGHPMTAGVILFAYNFKSVKESQALIKELKAIKPSLVVCGDFEGGHVSRMPSKPGFPSLISLRNLGRIYTSMCGDRFIREDAERRAAFLKELGITLNLAPVLDSFDPACGVIGGLDRAISENDDTCLAVAQAFIRPFKDCGIQMTGKHFPDHGIVMDDSHTTQPISSVSKEALFGRAHRVYGALIKEDLLDIIMTAHVTYTDVDPENPVTYSKIWWDFIRDDLGFRGLVVSDCLSMSGAEVGSTMEERAELALSNCCDWLILCHTPELTLQVLNHLKTLTFSEGSERRIEAFLAKQSLPSALSLPFLPGFEHAAARVRGAGAPESTPEMHRRVAQP